METIKASEITPGQIISLMHSVSTIFVLIGTEIKTINGKETVIFGGRNIYNGQIERFRLYSDSKVFLRELK